ncbi:MAG: hypothetical protein R3F55_03655 [Alphaproteobacteria bacterium]
MSVALTARCHPALQPILPRPVPAREARPDWLRDMPAEVPADSLGGIPMRTLKHCPPLVDALGLGLLMPLACDLHVADGEIAWDWNPPALPDQLTSRAPIGVHAPEQASGAPLAITGRFVVKFMNFWTLQAPPGWSVLFTHPFGRPTTPFHTLTGLVDCDSYADGYVHFPALWTDPAFVGTIPAGTPVAQAIPLPRDRIALTVETMDAAHQAATRELQQRLQDERGVYRKDYRSGD